MMRITDFSRIKAALRANHYGPGPHKDGSPQTVHGGGRSGSASTSGGQAAVSKSRGRVVAKMSWRDVDGKTHKADVYRVEQFGDLPKSGMGMMGFMGPNRGAFLFSPEGENAQGSATHGQMVRAVFPGENVDNYVRFYFTPKGLEFSVTSAAQEVSGDDWADLATSNIYKTLDKLAAAGVPGDIRS